MTEASVVYEAYTPHYLVQRQDWGWVAERGFDSYQNAVDYAQEQKRENPESDYRVVDTRGETDE